MVAIIIHSALLVNAMLTPATSHSADPKSGLMVNWYIGSILPSSPAT